MMHFISKVACSSAALLALTACGGGGGGGGIVIGADEEGLRLFADTDGDGNPDGDLEDLLDRGETVVARRVASATWREDYSGGDIYALERADISAELNGDDLEFTIGFPGETPFVVVVPNATTLDDNRFEFEDGGTFYEVVLFGGTFEDFLLGMSGYSRSFALFYDEFSDDEGLNTRFVLGAETQDADLLAFSADVVYDGYGEFNIRQKDMFFSEYNGFLNGDITLTADFDSNTVSGEMFNLWFRERFDRTGPDTWTTINEGSLDGTITMNTAGFNSNGFAGTMSPDADLLDDSELAGAIAGSIGYSGVFYGDDAQEVGGVFQGEVDVSDPGGTTTYSTIGNWLADSYP